MPRLGRPTSRRGWHEAEVSTANSHGVTLDGLNGSLGTDFAKAMATKDHDDAIAAFYFWFKTSDDIEGVDSVETDAFADRERVAYRFRVRRDDQLHLVEQQAQISERDGRIGWHRIMWAGYRPID
jgi:hypothetical protein